jgi:hypothetical protein
MCSTLRYGHRTVRVGGFVIGREWRSERAVEAKWTGFIREEKIEWWKKHTRLVPVEVCANSFKQKDIEFDVPTAFILGYQLVSKVLWGTRVVGEPNEIKIITRRCMNEYEASIHNRWPVIKTGKERTVFFFQPWDQQPGPEQLDLF